MCLLGRYHMYRAEEEEKEHLESRSRSALSSHHHSGTLSRTFWEEARRYMRYATAVYGQSMIDAAEVDARGRFDPRFGR
jgi:hypothetical protein